MPGSSDVKLGTIASAPFYIGEAQFEYWQNLLLIIDVVPGKAGMFSLEQPTGLRFLTRSRHFDDAENAWLATRPVERTHG